MCKPDPNVYKAKHICMYYKSIHQLHLKPGVDEIVPIGQIVHKISIEQK